MDKVIPRSIHYADLKPEAIDNNVKLVRFTPQTNIQNSVPNDVIRFLLQGNGFFDPYSAYLHIRFSFLRTGIEEFATQAQGGEECFADMKSSYDLKNNYGGKLDRTNKKNPTANLGNPNNDSSDTLEKNIHTCNFEGGCLSIDDVSTNLYMSEDTKYTQPRPGTEFKILDRSAHSLISRFVVRSQGVEIERIEQYDVMAAMINDLIYSNEQAQLHTFEGFAGSTLQHNLPEQEVGQLRTDTMANSCRGPRGRVGEVMFGWAFVAIDDMIESKSLISRQRAELTYDLRDDCRLDIEDIEPCANTYAVTGKTANFGQYTAGKGYRVDYGFANGASARTMVADKFQLATNFYEGLTVDTTYEKIVTYHLAKELFETRYSDSLVNQQCQMNPQALLNNNHANLATTGVMNETTHYSHLSTAEKNATPMIFTGLMETATTMTSSLYLKNFRPGTYHYVQLGNENYEFIIPIYSGSMGVLMPDKKLLPLSLYPLEIDFTLNNHAVICGASNTFGKRLSRGYQIKQMDLYAHMVFFEQEVHRSLESVVAEHGIFLNMKSFYLSPITVHPGDSVTSTIPINLHFKSINSVHLMFLYQNYENDKYARKLHFVSHHLQSIQLRNGTDMIPSEPIQIDWSGGQSIEGRNTSGTIASGRTARAFVEMLKSWDKMHDPMTDSALDNGLAFSIDQYATTRTDLASDFDVAYDNNSGVSLVAAIDTYIATHVGVATSLEDDNHSQFYIQNGLRYQFNDGAIPAGSSIDEDGQQYVRLSADTTGTLTTGVGEIAYNTIEGNYTLNKDSVKPYYNLQYKDRVDFEKHQYFGQYGANGGKIPLRPAMFFANLESPVPFSGVGSGESESLTSYMHGMSAKWLNDRIQNFSALVGRCQYSISLEGINLGSDESILTGKKGMTPFDIMVTSKGKGDRVGSISMVFCRYDAVVYIRPDLVVELLGK